MSTPHEKPAAAYQALATNGDGTLLTDKKMAAATAGALRRLRDSGRRVILATGENSEELADFPHLELVDLVVAENGAALYWPGSQDVRLLCETVPAELVRSLRRRGVEPLTAGRVIVCTERPNEAVVCDLLRGLGLTCQVVFNRDQLMVVPAGVNKASGLAAAASELGLAPEQIAGIGDGENDGPLLRCCGYGVAVASAVASLKHQADWVTAGGAGEGVVELVERLLAGSLPAPRPRAAP